MKKNLFCLFAALQCFGFVLAQGGSRDDIFRDTIYYDGNWDVIPFAEYAKYVRYTVEPDERFNLPKKFETYDMDGVMVEKGEFISILNNGDSVVYDGGVSRYVDGKLRSVYTYENGLLDGGYMEFFEGETYFKVGEYKGGKLYGNYFMSERGGKINSRYSYVTGERIVSEPNMEPNKVKKENGVLSLYYKWEGIDMRVRYNYNGDLGKKEKVEFAIINNNFEDIEIVADEVFAKGSYMGREYDMDVRSYKEHKKKMNASEILIGLAVGAMGAVSDTYGGTTTETVDVQSRDSHGNVTNSQVSVSYYDAERVAYDQAVREDTYAELEAEYAKKKSDYLHSCKLAPGEVLHGYVFLKNEITLEEDMGGGKVKKRKMRLKNLDLSLWGIMIDGKDFRVDFVGE